MSKHRRFLYLIIAIITLLTACTGDGGGGRPLETLVVGLEGNPSTLDPRYASDAYGVRIAPLIFNGLLKMDLSGSLVNDLAEKWEQPDALTHRLTLRKGVTFHDGSELDAGDVVATYHFAMDPQNGCPISGSLKTLESVEAPDPQTVLFKLKSPYVSFPFQLRLGILPSELAGEKALGERLIGTGPFRLITFKAGEEILLKGYKEHFGGAPKCESVRFRILTNATTRLLEVRSGGLDLLQNAVPPYSLKFLDREEGLKTLRAPGASYQYLGFNLEDPILSDIRVRRAIAHAIDRETLIAYVMQGQARPADSFFPPEHWAHTDKAPGYVYDPDLSKRLLDEAGLSDPDGEGPLMRVTLSYKTSTDKTANEAARVIADQLSKVGIGVEVRSFEWGTFFSDVKKGNFQLMSLRWVGISDPDVLYYIFHSTSTPPGGANRGRYSNGEVDGWLDASRVEFDLEKRAELYRRVQEGVVRDMVYVSLWWPDNVIVLSESVEDFVPYPGGEYTSLANVERR